MKHTKGPWHIGKPFGVNNDCYSVFCNDETESRGPSSVGSTSLENARLIAAAPELLQSCKELLIGARSVSLILTKQMESAIDLAKKAVSKAEGIEL